MPRDCPLCGLVNPDTAPTCDCGYSFAHAGTVGRVQLAAAARQNMMIGGLVCLAGLVVTLLTWAASSVTGFSLVAWGAIVFGAAQFVRGVLQLRKERQFAAPCGNAGQDGTAAEQRSTREPGAGAM